jgi:hypothetical protein
MNDNEALDMEIDSFALLDAIYHRKIDNGWTIEEAADLCGWLAIPKPVDGEPREITRMRGIRETCERHGMMDLLEAEEQAARAAKAEWDKWLVNDRPVEVYA